MDEGCIFETYPRTAFDPPEYCGADVDGDGVLCAKHAAANTAYLEAEDLRWQLNRDRNLLGD